MITHQLNNLNNLVAEYEKTSRFPGANPGGLAVDRFAAIVMEACHGAIFEDNQPLFAIDQTLAFAREGRSTFSARASIIIDARTGAGVFSLSFNANGDTPDEAAIGAVRKLIDCIENQGETICDAGK